MNFRQVEIHVDGAARRPISEFRTMIPPVHVISTVFGGPLAVLAVLLVSPAARKLIIASQNFFVQRPRNRAYCGTLRILTGSVLLCTNIIQHLPDNTQQVFVYM